MMGLRDLLRPWADSSRLPTITVTGVTCHSKQVRPGHIFVAIRGTHHDGHAFLEEARQRGACALVVERPPENFLSCPVVQVPDTRRALAAIAAQFYGHVTDRPRLVGVTGTCGKTTTAYLLKAILEAAGHHAGLVGTIAYEIGARHLPSTNTTPGSLELQRLLAQMAEQRLDWCAMEVSSHALDQRRLEGLELDAAIWTYLGADHLDYHKTIEHYAEAKRRIFSYLRPDGYAVVNVDDPYGRVAASALSTSSLVTYGLESDDAMVRVGVIESYWQGLSLVLETPWGAIPVHTPLVGRHNILNVVAASSACLALGVPAAALQHALAEFSQVPGRLERVPNDADLHVIIDYAHTADALRAVLLSLRELVRGRLILVFGCGGDRDRTKRPVMGQVASLLADYVILTSDNPRSEDPLEIAQQIRAGFVPGFRDYAMVMDREEAIASALSIARPDDGVLIAGKGHEAYQIFDHVTTPFSDRDVIERYVTRSARTLVV